MVDLFHILHKLDTRYNSVGKHGFGDTAILSTILDFIKGLLFHYHCIALPWKHEFWI